MAIVFPRELPSAFATDQQFEPQRVDFLSPEAGGRLGAVTAGTPLWSATWTIGNLGLERSDEVRAWVASLRGPGRLFYGRDLARRVPRFHAGGIPFTAAPSGWSQEIDAAGTALLTLTGVLDAMVLSWGDYVGFSWGDGSKRTMARAIDRGIAADGALTFAVEPPVPALVPEDAAVTLVDASCTMRITSETELGPLDRSLAIKSGRIVALQHLVP